MCRGWAVSCRTANVTCPRLSVLGSLTAEWHSQVNINPARLKTRRGAASRGVPLKPEGAAVQQLVGWMKPPWTPKAPVGALTHGHTRCCRLHTATLAKCSLWMRVERNLAGSCSAGRACQQTSAAVSSTPPAPLSPRSCFTSHGQPLVLCVFNRSCEQKSRRQKHYAVPYEHYLQIVSLVASRHLRSFYPTSVTTAMRGPAGVARYEV